MSMNELERQLQYPAGDTLPEPGRTIELAPGLRWVRMGLPFALDHINLWLLRDRQEGIDGWTIVDFGISLYIPVTPNELSVLLGHNAAWPKAGKGPSPLTGVCPATTPPSPIWTDRNCPTSPPSPFRSATTCSTCRTTA